MYLIPLNQLESVELVIHSLKMAGGQADCSTCPAHRVCMKQCLTIATAIEDMLAGDSLPQLERPTSAAAQPSTDEPDDSPPKGRSRLTVIK